MVLKGEYFSFCKNISLWEGVVVLEVKYCDVIGISKLLGLQWDLFLLSDVPLPVRMS